MKKIIYIKAFYRYKNKICISNIIMGCQYGVGCEILWHISYIIFLKYVMSFNDSDKDYIICET